jgi:phage terminase large subunit-like protein
MAGMKARRQESLRSFLDLCQRGGFEPEGFQRRIAGAFFGPEDEFLALLPRGNGKSRLVGALAVHHLLTHPEPRVYVAAASREQASVIHEYARSFALAIDPDIVVNQREIRTDDGYLRIVASDAPKLMGLTPSLAIVDELHAHKDESVYLALRTALLKRPGAKMAVISTAGDGIASPLGRLRQRALAGEVTAHGVTTDARTPTLRMLEWMARDDRMADDMREAWRCNPASWITEKRLREQYEALPEIAWRRFHLNQWAGRIGSWLPPGSWQACSNGKRPEPGCPIWIGVDLGGARADSACVWVSRLGDDHYAVDCSIHSGEDGMYAVQETILRLAERFQIREVVFDPWRAAMLVRGLEQRGIRCTVFAQSDSRMIPASAALHTAIVEGRIHHPDDEQLNAHVSAAVARHGRRGWRIDQAERGANIDGLVALAMAYESATQPEEPGTQILGYL